MSPKLISLYIKFHVNGILDSITAGPWPGRGASSLIQDGFDAPL